MPDAHARRQDVGAPADEVTVTTGKGRVFVTQRAGDDAAATVDSTARRSAALARSLDGCETGGKTIETVTWAAVDEGGNVQVAVTNSPGRSALRRHHRGGRQRLGRACDIRRRLELRRRA